MKNYLKMNSQLKGIKINRKISKNINGNTIKFTVYFQTKLLDSK
jgi:hypothetical protein